MGFREDRPIADYALIGDAHGAALVSRDGSIDWCCLPHVDSPAFFLRLLDRDRGGYFQIAPGGDVPRIDRRYRPDTNILETTFYTTRGVLRLRDAFDVGPYATHRVGDPPARSHRVLRLAECLTGAVTVDWRCFLTPDFARMAPVVDRLGQGVVRWSWGDQSAVLAGSVPASLDDSGVRGREHLQVGEQMAFMIGDQGATSVSVGDVVERLARVERHWQGWVAQCRYDGPYRDAVVRSALILKLLTHEPTGAVVAAPTTSLPEAIGGERNWDYRYCWLRDATFTLHALELLGYVDEAHDFMHWIQRVCTACGVDLKIMYGVQGQRELTEVSLDHLRGYRASRPVRVGNAAYRQQQLDVFGEVLDSAFLFFEGIQGAARYYETLNQDMWGLLRSLVDHVAGHWEQPDSGIWEMRGRPQHFLHSKLLCWVALDRGIKLARHNGLTADLAAWERERGRVRAAILHRGYSEHLGSFTQALGREALDASALLMPVLGFLEARDPRMLSTIDAICEHLVEDGMVHRYRTDDGLKGTDGAFPICTFWLVDALALAGRRREATDLFERMLARANDVGLYSEEVEPGTGEFLGNFPQAFTHIALIRSALLLEAAPEA